MEPICSTGSTSSDFRDNCDTDALGDKPAHSVKRGKAYAKCKMVSQASRLPDDVLLQRIARAQPHERLSGDLVKRDRLVPLKPWPFARRENH
jgi:hypothetical protein